MIKKILVTGSNGTIGIRLCEKLIGFGYGVIGVDIKKNAWNKRVDKITVNLDLRSKDDIQKMPKNVDCVVHLAANARVFNLVKDPSLARDNFEMLFNTLEYARTVGVKRFIFASSREVYGNLKKIIHKEDEAEIKNCESPYTASKIAGEALIHAYCQCYGIEFVIVRFSNVYGMYDNSDRLIPLYIRLARRSEDFVVYGKDKLLDFTYIDDAVDGVMRIIKIFNKVKNSTFNLAYGKGISLIAVARIIKKLMKIDNQIILEPNRTGEVVKYIADISRAKKLLGYSPKTAIAEGIKKAIKWYTEHVNV